MHVTINTIDLF